MKIGFQGVLFSNSEEAAIQFAKTHGLKTNQFIPLITSQNVVSALINKKIDYGVLAIQNKIAGIVKETTDALTENIEPIDSLYLPIHHALFKKNKNSKIDFIASHIQALNQTKEYRRKNLPTIKEIESEDSAISAKKLSTGIYPENYAVICKKNAGEFYNLFLIDENIEDDKENETLFGLFKLKRWINYFFMLYLWNPSYQEEENYGNHSYTYWENLCW